jgi:hypothetical protein
MEERMSISELNQTRAFNFIMEKIAERVMRDAGAAASVAFELVYAYLVDEENKCFNDPELLNLSLQGIDEIGIEIVRELQDIEDEEEEDDDDDDDE